MLLSSRLKERWKMLLLLGLIWILIVFPIPFLPAWGYPIDETSLRTLMIITTIISIPFTLLAIFMNDGNKERSTY
jgi:O-antigen/teichoic acid export membrane protein